MIAFPPLLAWTILALTALVLLPLLAFGAHRTHLLVLARRPAPPLATGRARGLPRVTVQLPVYNEAGVVERLIDAAAALDHPRARLQIQLLDDSTDETTELAAARIRHWAARGVEIDHLKRSNREGFKAGALQNGLATATGEFILILDADFVPEPDLLRRLLPPFDDPDVGMVQARWDHLNEEEGLLTRCQALLLDAHFFFEQGGRYRGERFVNFNGTAGIWRRSALEEAGGWSADTLTEDLDLSYRCQMKGWRFVFLDEVGVPAEIPGDVASLELQQKRWSQGGIQTARKILPELLASDRPLRIRSEAVVHLLGHLAHPLTLALGVLLLPSAVARRSLGLEELLVLDLVVFAGATLSFLAFYTAAGLCRRRPLARLLPTAVATLALGVGLTAAVSRAVLRGVRGGDRDPFARTPKRGGGRQRYGTPSRLGDLLLKGLLLGWVLVSLTAAIAWGIWTSVPFLLLFGSGYAWVLVGQLLGPREDGAASGGGHARGEQTRSVREPSSEEPVEAGRAAALIPALDEEEALPALLDELNGVGLGEVVVVDNGSTDRTAEVARAGGARVVHEPERGYGAACLAGIGALAEGGDPPGAVLFLDGDGSDDPAEAHRILGPLARGEADLVIGVRRAPAGEAVRVPLHARLGNRLVRGGAWLLHGARIRDFGPFRAIRWEALEALGMDDRNYGWTLQMQLRAHRAGLRVLEVPVAHRPRRAGRSKVSGSVRGSVLAGTKMLLTLVTELRAPQKGRGRPERAVEGCEMRRTGQGDSRIMRASRPPT